MYPGYFAAKNPQRLAAIMGDTGAQITYGELDERSAKLARFLRERGLRAGDHLALISDNDLRCFEVYWSALRSGLYITAVNRHLTPAEMGYIVDDCGASALVVSASLSRVVEEVVSRCANIKTRLAFGGDVPGFASYEESLALMPDGLLRDQPRGADMLYSSGTTGQPKGIKQPLPNRQVDEPGDPLVKLFSKLYALDEDTIYLSPAPLYHAAPLRFGGVIQSLGGTVVALKRFEAEAALSAIERYRVTHSQWVPTMFVRMLKLPEKEKQFYDLSSMKVAIHAAAPCPIEVKQAMINWWGAILHEYYASTEGNGGTFINTEEWLQKPGSVGKAGLGIIHICADDGHELSPGQIGMVYFERDELPFRYHNDDKKTQAAIHPQHPTWTTTGDIGYVDEDGYLFLTDRKAFVIISGGVNIYPQEIENCLALHPAVRDVAVIGVPDAEMGESVKAIIEPAAGINCNDKLAQELIEYVRSKIAHYKTPRSVDFVDQLPRMPTGKLAKAELLARYRQAARLNK